MAMEELPKKMLIIKDCTFILPADFSGTVEDAFTEFLNYRANNLDNAKYCDPNGLFSPFNLLIHGSGNSRACGQYVLYELKDGQYVAVDGTIPKS